MLIVIASSARDQINHKTVAVKKLCEPFKTNNIAKHIFREVKLLKQFQHDNIIRLNDIFISPSEEIYLVTDLIATDLQTLLRTKKVDNQFTQYFLYQIMVIIHYLRSKTIIVADFQ
jgi:p38 MAP kinase